jgi:DNA-binding CsgD family transcriptional regulator
MRLIGVALSEPDISGVLISGGPGVGKSRVAREALTVAAANGRQTRWAVATSNAKPIPLGALAAWVPPDLADSLQLVRRVVDSLTSAAAGTTVVIGVDDAHLLDDLSAFVLHRIVVGSAAKVLLTVRDEEPIPAALHDVLRAGAFDRLDLHPISRNESAELTSSALGGPIDARAADRLWELTRGNTLYLSNIVEREVADGRLTQSNGRWRWSGNPVLPPSLVELIESRIGALSGPVSDVLDVLTIGEPMTMASLGRITDPAAIEQADERGLISIDDSGAQVEVRLAHPLYGEVRQARGAQSRLRRLRGCVAAELATCEDGLDVQTVVRRAALSLDSDLPPDPDLLIEAGRMAIGLGDLQLAERLGEAAFRAGGGQPAVDVRAHALTFLGRGEEAYALGAVIDNGKLTDDARAAITFKRACIRMFNLRDPTGAKDLVQEVSGAIQPGARRCTDAFVAVYWTAMGEIETAREAMRGFTVDELPGMVGVETAFLAATAAGLAGCTTEAEAMANAGYAIVAKTVDTAHMKFAVADAHVRSLVLSGRIHDALAVAEQLRHETADVRAGMQLLSGLVFGRAVLGGGNVRAASAVFEPLVDGLIAMGESAGGDYEYDLVRTTARAMRGLTDEAAATLAALKQRRHPAMLFLDYEYALTCAWVAACQGVVSEAIRTLLSTAGTGGRKGQFAAEVMCLQTATQFGHPSCEPRLRELEAVVEGPRVGLAVRFAKAMRSGDGDELASVSEEFEQMGDIIAAADAAAHASVAHRRSDRRGTALVCKARAAMLAEDCGGLRTPALHQISGSVPLTNREREIVILIGEGLSTRAIAERLSLSLRTVEGHIYRAMTKTGTASRDELIAALPRRR